MKIIFLIITDSFTFFLALLCTYSTFISFNQTSFSWILLKAYVNFLVFLWFFFLIVLNLFGFYNLKKNIASVRNICFAVFTYHFILFIFSFMYSNYQFFRTLLMINLAFVYLFFNILHSKSLKAVSRFNLKTGKEIIKSGI